MEGQKDRKMERLKELRQSLVTLDAPSPTTGASKYPIQITVNNAKNYLPLLKLYLETKMYF